MMMMAVVVVVKKEMVDPSLTYDTLANVVHKLVNN